MAVENGRLLSNAVYQDLDGLTRSIHFSELKQCYNAEELVPSELTSERADTSDVGEMCCILVQMALTKPPVPEVL